MSRRVCINTCSACESSVRPRQAEKVSRHQSHKMDTFQTGPNHWGQLGHNFHQAFAYQEPFAADRHWTWKVHPRSSNFSTATYLEVQDSSKKYQARNEIARIGHMHRRWITCKQCIHSQYYICLLRSPWRT